MTTATALRPETVRDNQRRADREDGLVSLNRLFVDIAPLTEVIERIGGVGAAFDKYPANRRSALRRTYYRGVKSGRITAAAADTLACAVGRHPFEVWGTVWWEID